MYNKPKTLQEALDLFYKQYWLAAAFKELHNLGKLWHLDDDPYDCGFSDEEAALLKQFQADVWAFAKAEGVDPFAFYPMIE